MSDFWKYFWGFVMTIGVAALLVLVGVVVNEANKEELKKQQENTAFSVELNQLTKLNTARSFSNSNGFEVLVDPIVIDSNGAINITFNKNDKVTGGEVKEYSKLKSSTGIFTNVAFIRVVNTSTNQEGILVLAITSSNEVYFFEDKSLAESFISWFFSDAEDSQDTDNKVQDFRGKFLIT